MIPDIPSESNQKCIGSEELRDAPDTIDRVLCDVVSAASRVGQERRRVMEVEERGVFVVLCRDYGDGDRRRVRLEVSEVAMA